MKRLLLAPLILSLGLPTKAAPNTDIHEFCLADTTSSADYKVCVEAQTQSLDSKNKDIVREKEKIHAIQLLVVSSCIEENKVLNSKLINKDTVEWAKNYIRKTYRDNLGLLNKSRLLTYVEDQEVQYFADFKANEYKLNCLGISKDKFTLKELRRSLKERKLTEKKCLKANDYEGCMRYETRTQKIANKSKKNISKFNKSNESNQVKDCIKNFCIGDGKTDMLGKPSIPNWIYKEFPHAQTVMYTDNRIPYKVKVRGEYGRYIHIRNIRRMYQNPRAGTSGMPLTIGSGSTNCYGFGSSINCTSTPPTTINIPGTPSIAGGVIQETEDYIIDCKEQTFGYHVNRVLTRHFATKKKWSPLSHKKADLTSKSFAKEYCSKVESLEESDFTLYED